MSSIKKLRVPEPDLDAPNDVERTVWQLVDLLELSQDNVGQEASKRVATAALMVAKSMLGLEAATTLASGKGVSADVITSLERKVQMAYDAMRRVFPLPAALQELKQQNETLQKQVSAQLKLIDELRERLAALPPAGIIEELIEREIASVTPIDARAIRKLEQDLRSHDRRLDELEEPKKLKTKRSHRTRREAA